MQFPNHNKIFFVLCILMFSGCAVKKASVSQYAGKIQHLKGTAILKIQTDGIKRSFDVVFAITPPDSFRANFLAPTGAVLFDAGSDGRKKWGMGRLRGYGIKIAPEEFIAILLGEDVLNFPVQFDDYKVVNGISIPHKIMFDGKRGEKIIVLYKDVEVITK